MRSPRPEVSIIPSGLGKPLAQPLVVGLIPRDDAVVSIARCRCLPTWAVGHAPHPDRMPREWLAQLLAVGHIPLNDAADTAP